MKINHEKSEICGIGSKKGVLKAFSNLSSVDVENDTVKILGFHHSYNKQLAGERNFSNMVTDIHNVLNLWTMRGISLIGKILIFKTLGISKLQYIAYMAQVPDKIIRQLQSIKKNPMEIKYTKNKTLYIDSWLQRWGTEECRYWNKTESS